MKTLMYGRDEFEILITFYINDNLSEYIVEYKVEVAKEDDQSFIKNESLNYKLKDLESDLWLRKKSLFMNNSHALNISPSYRSNEILSMYEDNITFYVYKRSMLKEKKSLFFSEEFANKLNIKLVEKKAEYRLITLLHDYAASDLFIVDSKLLGLSDANLLLPINFKNYKEDKIVSMGVMGIGLEKPSFIPKYAIEEIESSLNSSNIVISEIIPGLSIRIREINYRISEDGLEEGLIELLSCRDGVEIPIRYESDGIKKIVSVIHLLIAMYNNRSMTVLIDELDSGIFEYLLGEILKIIEERGKGQLIFTSHNLRPLEVLDKNKLVFTTINPDNRYIRLENVKTNNNLRDFYYRDLVLGGQKEAIYHKTNSAKIARAFRKAGG